jgi:hypothetical protein
MMVLRRLFRYLAPYWKQLVLTATLLVLLTVLELLCCPLSSRSRSLMR